MSELPQFGADTPQRRAANASQLWEARQRTRDRVADQFDTVDNPDQIPVRRQEQNRLAPGEEFLQWAQPREAAHDFDPKFPRQDLGADDVRRTDDGGFAPTEGVQRRSAAFEFEEQTPLDNVDPFADLQRQDGGGFGLDQGAQREAAARELDPQYPDVEIGAGDVQREGDAFGLTPNAERSVAAERIEDDTPLNDVGPGDVRRTDNDGFELRDSVIDENRGLFF